MRSSSGVAFIRSAPPLTPLPHVSFFLSALLSIRPGGLVGYACASERVSVPVNERVRERERESCKSKWRVRPQPMTQYDGLSFYFLPTNCPLNHVCVHLFAAVQQLLLVQQPFLWRLGHVPLLAHLCLDALLPLLYPRTSSNGESGPTISSRQRLGATVVVRPLLFFHSRRRLSNVSSSFFFFLFSFFATRRCGNSLYAGGWWMALPAGLCCFQQQKLTLSFIFFFLQQDCPSGRLTPAKFVDMYKMFFPNGNAEEFCDHVFRTFDRDKNGFIDFKVSVFSFSSCGGDQLVQVL